MLLAYKCATWGAINNKTRRISRGKDWLLRVSLSGELLLREIHKV